MSELATLDTVEGVEAEKDVLSSSGPLDSGIYLSEVTQAYLETAKSEALAVVLHLKTDSGRQLRQKLWVRSGKAKGKRNYSENDKGEKQYLPGFNAANSLCLLTVGKALKDMATENKYVNIYNYTSKTEVPTEVPVLTALIGQKVYAGVIRQTVDKQVKNDQGQYVANGETRDENEIDKFFRERDKLTTAEILAERKEVGFFNDWAEKNTGITRNRAKGAANGAPAAPGQAATSAAKPTESLFG